MKRVIITLALAIGIVMTGGCNVSPNGETSTTNPACEWRDCATPPGLADEPAPEPTEVAQVCEWGDCDTPPEPVEKPAPMPTDADGDPIE